MKPIALFELSRIFSMVKNWLYGIDFDKLH